MRQVEFVIREYRLYKYNLIDLLIYILSSTLDLSLLLISIVLVLKLENPTFGNYLGAAL